MQKTDNPHFFEKFMNPKSVAFYGANENVPNNMGSFQLLTLIDNGYKGKIFPIHPKLEEIFGLKAYKSVLDIDEPIDLAKLILPKRYVPDILKELGEKGVKNIIMVTAGYREIHDDDSRDEIIELINKYGFHILGPNCIGILNTHTRYSDEVMVNNTDEIKNKECILNTTVQTYNLPPGNVSIASHSGTFVSHGFMLVAERDLRLSKCFSLGNEINIDLCDCLEYLENDPNTEVIMLYIEEIKRGRLFFKLAKRISPKKIIIVLYPGGSKGGAKSIASHTGSLAGNDEIHNALFHQSGIIRTYSLEEFFDTGMMFSKLIPLGAIPKGNRIAVMTNSGGPGALMADRLSRLDMILPAFNEKISKKIKKILPPTAQVANPLDFTFSLNPAQFHYSIPRLIARSGDFDAMVTYGAFGNAFFRYQNFGKKFLELPKNREKLKQWVQMVETSVDSAQRIVKKFKFPVINVNLQGLDEPIFSYLNKRNFPTFRMPHQAVNALKNLIEYGKFRENINRKTD